MRGTVYLSAEDLAALIDGAFAYDGRGPVVRVEFFDANGLPVLVSEVAITSEERGLTVFARPMPEGGDHGPAGGEAG